MNIIQTIQNHLLKLILKLDRRTSTKTVQRYMHILKISHIADSCVLGFVNDVRIGRCPEIFLDYYTWKPNSYDLRTKRQLKVPQTRLVLGDKSVKIKSALRWNRMDKSMLKHRFTKSFRKTLVKHYIILLKPWAVDTIYVKWKPNFMYVTAIKLLWFSDCCYCSFLMMKVNKKHATDRAFLPSQDYTVVITWYNLPRGTAARITTHAPSMSWCWPPARWAIGSLVATGSLILHM